MPGRYAIFVDAAFLWASAGEVLYGTNDRSRLTCAYESLLEAMIARTGQHSRRELLRVYWYDGAVNKVPTPDQRRLGLVPSVKLRLGRVVSGHQKGVDSLIVLDLLRLSGTGMVDTIYLLSGDDDLTEGVREAQAGGVRLVLVGAATAVPRHSEALVLEADGVELWARDFWAPHFSPSGTAVGSTARMAPASAVGPGSAEATGATAARPIAGPASRSVPGGGREGRDDRETREARGGGRNGIGPAVVEAVRTFERVGHAFARRWLSEVGSDQHDRVRCSRPRIPADIDARLLWDTSAGRDLSEGERVALRDGFWRALDEQTAAPRPVRLDVDGDVDDKYDDDLDEDYDDDDLDEDYDDESDELDDVDALDEDEDEDEDEEDEDEDEGDEGNERDGRGGNGGVTSSTRPDDD